MIVDATVDIVKRLTDLQSLDTLLQVRRCLPSCLPRAAV